MVGECAQPPNNAMEPTLEHAVGGYCVLYKRSDEKYFYKLMGYMQSGITQ